MNDGVGVLDFKYILQVLKKGIIWIILSTVIVGVGAYLYAQFFVTPLYSSTVDFYVLPGKDDSEDDEEGGTIAGGTIAVSSRLVNTYRIILTEPDAAAELAEYLKGKTNKEYSAGSIQGSTSVYTKDEDAMIMTISCSCDDPEDAQTICQAYCDKAQDIIVEATKTGYIYPVSTPTRSWSPYFPDKFRYTMFGAVIGFALSFVVCIIIAIADTTIKSEEDLKERINLPILGQVPTLNAATNNKKGYYEYRSGGAEDAKEN